MIKIAVIFADGTEEIEGLTVVDVLRRANIKCDIVSLHSITPTGSHNIKIFADKTCKELNIDEYDGIVIPGGLMGAKNISNSKIIGDSIIKAFNDKKMVASICASPAVVLSKLGILQDKNVTCFPAPEFIESLSSANYVDSHVVVDGNIITADGPRSSLEFSLAICKYLGVEAKI